MEYDNCFSPGGIVRFFIVLWALVRFFVYHKAMFFFLPETPSRDTIPRHPETRRDPETRLRHLPRHGIPMFLSSNINTFCRHQLLQTKKLFELAWKMPLPSKSSRDVITRIGGTSQTNDYSICLWDMRRRKKKKIPNMKRLHLSHRGLSPLISATYMIRWIFLIEFYTDWTPKLHEIFQAPS